MLYIEDFSGFFLSRWTGSSVMAAATSGFIKCVWVFLQRWQKKKTIFVQAVPERILHIESKSFDDHSGL